MVEFTLKAVKFEGKEYSPAEIVVDEEAGTIQFYSLKKGFLHRKPERKPITSRSFGPKTKVTVREDMTAIEVEDIIMFAEKIGDLEKVSEALLKPARRLKEKVEETVKVVAEMLNTRARALEDMLSLKNSPRKTLISEKIVCEGNPIELFTVKREDTLSRELERFKDIVGGGELDETFVEKTCAFIVAATYVQNSIFLNDKSIMDEASALLSDLQIRLEKVDSIASATENLVSEYAKACGTTD